MFKYAFLFLLGVNVSLFSSQGAKAAITVDNRVLATVRDQIITVHDVSKKLDMVFYKTYPQYRNSPEARCEFYKANWRKMLEDLIDRELVLTWAEERQFQVSNGDLRQELEEMFGPDVMINLYESGLSLHDVQEMLRADILMRRVLYSFVRVPVLATITPRDVRALYVAKAKEASSQEIFCWKSVSIKEKGQDCSKKTAESVLNMFRKDHLDLQVVLKKLPQNVEVTQSQLFRLDKKDIAPHIYDILSKLEIGAYSDLVSVADKQEGQKGWRFYVLEAKEKGKLPPLVDIEEELRGELAYPEIEKKTRALLDDLRTQYQVTQLIPANEMVAFEPFSVHSGSSPT